MKRFGIHISVVRWADFVVAAVILGAAQPGACAKITDDHCIDSAMICLVKQRYDAAYEVVEKVLETNKGNMDALYMLLVINQTNLLDYESYAVEGPRFLRLADSVCSVLRQELAHSKGEDSVKCLFYIGNVYGGRSLILAKCGSWFEAAREALTSVAILKQVNQIDSTFYAAFLGLGVFNYYLSQNLGWIPFMGNKSNEGLRQIETATLSPFPFNYAARNSLAWILIDRGEFARADSIVDLVLKEIPGNTIFLRIKARIALWTGRNADAVRYGRELAALSLKRNPVNWSDCLSGYQVVAECSLKQGDTVQCRATSAQALSLDVPESAQKIPYVRKHLAYLHAVSGK